MTDTIVLLSGGIDSTVTLAQTLERRRSVLALTVDYGQRHAVEIHAARGVAQAYGVEHHVTRIDLTAFGGSALTAHDGALERGRTPDEIERGPAPRAYVPARNTVMLALALGWAEARGASEIVIGANKGDIHGFPDCRPEFLGAFERVANFAHGQRNRTIRIAAPLMGLRKAHVLREGCRLGVDFGACVTCYDATFDGACGTCDACAIRLGAFAALDWPDPARYRRGIGTAREPNT